MTPAPAPPSRPTAAVTDRAPAYPDQFAAAVSSQLYAGRLARRPVALVTMPGADPATVAALTSQVKAAGGQLTGDYAVGSQLVDAEQKSLVDTLGSSSTASSSSRSPRTATTYPRIGQLVAVALATRGTAARQPTDDAIAVRQSLAAAKLVTMPSGSPPPAAVLVVMGRPVDQAIADGFLTGLAGRLARRRRGRPDAGRHPRRPRRRRCDPDRHHRRRVGDQRRPGGRGARSGARLEDPGWRFRCVGCEGRRTLR